jgi:hypothetical protein
MSSGGEDRGPDNNDDGGGEKGKAPRWGQSALPFFVVLRDNSTYVLPPGAGGSNNSASGDNEAIHSQSTSAGQTADEDDGESSSQTVEKGRFACKQLYPEVRYVFEDDDFNPTIEALDQEPGDVSVVVDFDQSGEKVVSYRSLSPYWQVVNVSSDDSAAPSWMGHDQSSIKLIVDGTSSKTELVRKRPNASSENSASTASAQSKATETSQLMQAVIDRTDQLKQLLNNSSS